MCGKLIYDLIRGLWLQGLWHQCFPISLLSISFDQVERANQYLLVEAQGSQGLFDCRQMFPALGRGCGHWRGLSWKSSTKVSGIKRQKRQTLTNLLDSCKSVISIENKVSPSLEGFRNKILMRGLFCKVSSPRIMSGQEETGKPGFEAVI